jgi:polyisoprenoid-binding protein YceI
MAAGQTHTVGPDRGKIILNTNRVGLAAQVGHDLTIEVTRWSGEILLAEDPAESTLSITAETGSLRVLEGKGGIKPLSEGDKREILKNARKILDSDRQPELRYRSTKITPGSNGGTVEGTLSLHGKENPVRFEITALGDGRYRAKGRIIQSEFGIKPYSAFLGALKLADPVEVTAEVDLS